MEERRTHALKIKAAQEEIPSIPAGMENGSRLNTKIHFVQSSVFYFGNHHIGMELEEGKPVFKNRYFGLFYFISSPIGSTGYYWVCSNASQWFVPWFVPSIA